MWCLITGLWLCWYLASLRSRSNVVLMSHTLALHWINISTTSCVSRGFIIHGQMGIYPDKFINVKSHLHACCTWLDARELERWVIKSRGVILAQQFIISCDTDQHNPVNTNHLYSFCTMLEQVKDVGPTLYKCYTSVLCLLGKYSVAWSSL